MSTRSRGHCSGNTFNRSNRRFKPVPFEAVGEAPSTFSPEHDSEDQTIIYNNAMMLAGALDLAEPSHDSKTDMGDDINVAVTSYGIDIYVDEATGEVKEVDYDDTVDYEVAYAANIVKLRFTASLTTETSSTNPNGKFSTRYGFAPATLVEDTDVDQFDIILEARAQSNLQLTLNMLDEQ